MKNLLALPLFFCNQVDLADGFVTLKQNGGLLTKNNDHDSIKICSEARIESVIYAAGGGIEDEPKIQSRDNDYFEEDFFSVHDMQPGGVDRRQFFISMVGAASLLALSEDAYATGTNPLPEPMEAKSSSTIDISSTAALASTDATAPTASAPPIDTRAIFTKAGKKALGGGKAGAAAAVVQVLSLMWLRTSMNYQYRFGGTLSSSLKELYSEGGIPRLYQGLPFALVQVRRSLLCLGYFPYARTTAYLNLLSQCKGTTHPIWGHGS